MRSVFADTNVLTAGANSRSGAGRTVLMLAGVGLFWLVVCHQVLDEAERNIRKKLPNLGYLKHYQRFTCPDEVWSFAGFDLVTEESGNSRRLGQNHVKAIPVFATPSTLLATTFSNGS